MKKHNTSRLSGVTKLKNLHTKRVTKKFLETMATIIAQKQAIARRCSVKKVFLEISQNSQENTCARVSFLINLGLQLY